MLLMLTTILAWKVCVRGELHIFTTTGFTHTCTCNQGEKETDGNECMTHCDDLIPTNDLATAERVNRDGRIRLK